MSSHHHAVVAHNWITDCGDRKSKLNMHFDGHNAETVSREMINNPIISWRNVLRVRQSIRGHYPAISESRAARFLYQL